MEENNKIIAEFLGLIKTNIEVEDVWSTVEYLSDNPESTLICSVPIDTTPQFHRSWDCLMSVVEKIEKEFCSTDIHYYHKKKMYSVQFLGFNIEYDNSEYGDDKMKILYDSCVKFINFYNKQEEG